jgi:hypothetical protein
VLTTRQAVADQLASELDAALVGPVNALLGSDLADQVSARVTARLPMLVEYLCGDDDQLLAETVLDVLGALFPDQPPDEWWRTPLGRRCAASAGLDDTSEVTHSVAAAMLGISRNTVPTLLDRGALDRHPDGGVTRASVFARLSRLPPKNISSP